MGDDDDDSDLKDHRRVEGEKQEEVKRVRK